MQYVALFVQEKHGYMVEFPDFPACVTFGVDLDEAVDMAHEALAMFVEEMVAEGQELPTPKVKKSLLAMPENQGKKAINIKLKGDGTDFEEFEVVMHAHLLERIEKYCRDQGASPADFLAAAARDAIRTDIFQN
ncbi:type II toxin-antitoxin system HicB family antitoxin [Pseudodesulfovibrio sediminis]|uniref:HicB-like antitoxin of toxin-antitoxin system domain-containing protein n=1 Tax=Pseudodesulfovibrio sediminis TaxID=2810563 RepID=A0ABM7P3S7_9BACT|nr:type II toxin-antitoxin system HicB family antitoxin [Pseudodesulfovibrio sediminis]BCS87520.1 hypothetical protein PSDVSF_07620 [Pseudodesulfovibrio sediminis]